MIKYCILALVFGVFAFQPGALGQIESAGTPLSQQYALESPAPEIWAEPLPERMNLEDARGVDGGYPVGYFIPVTAQFNTHGTWTIRGNMRIWRLTLATRDAQAVGVLFSQLHLPRGGSLYAYSEDASEVYGAFTSFNNSDAGWAIRPVHGSSITLEYNAPLELEDPIINVEGISYNYRGFERSFPGFGDSDPCQVNANCPEGNNWRDQQRSVVRLYLKEGFQFAYCSGSLINNTAQDCTPYILSADHCAGQASASDMNQWVFFFNYEAPTCTNPTSQSGLTGQSIIGCSLVARTNGSVSSGSDFLLVELNNPVPDSYEPYYAGWKRSNIPSGSGVGIHHPSGDIKKISTYTTPTATATLGNPPNTHWRVYWSATTSGHGVTEGGSSGSPLISNDGFIIGILSAGLSFCDATNEPDWYGKFSFSWTSNGSAANQQLEDWLDPVGSAPLTLAGTNSPCSGIGISESAGMHPLRVYPNPSDRRLILSGLEAFGNGVIEVINASGQRVYHRNLADLKQLGANEAELDVAGWATGVYAIRLITLGQVYSTRFIKD